MRHFLSKAPAHDLMRRLIDVAMHVWSVASLQPLRVLRITSAGLYVELFDAVEHKRFVHRRRFRQASRVVHDVSRNEEPPRITKVLVMWSEGERFPRWMLLWWHAISGTWLPDALKVDQSFG